MLAIMAGSFITGVCSVTPQIFIPMVSLFSMPDEKEQKTGMVLSGLLTGMLASTTIVFKVLPNVPTTYRGTFFSILKSIGELFCILELSAKLAVIGISRGRVIAYPERHLSKSLGFLKIFVYLLLPLSYLRGATLDFVDTPLADVVRAMSRAYDTPMLVDDSLNFRVTFHLDGVGVMEGLTALCSAHGLEVVQEGSVFHVRRARARGESEFRMQDSLVTLSVKGQEVNDFVREFALNSGLNILASPGLEGRITGTLRGMPAEEAFRALMGAHGFRVWREGKCLRIGEKRRQSAKAGANDRGGTSSGNIRLERDGDLYSAEIAEGELLQVLDELADLSGLNLAVYGDVHETVRLKFDSATLEDLVESLFRGRRYSYVLDSNTLYVSEGGMRNALSTTCLYPLRHIHSERALAHLGKVSPSANFVSTEVKEQNALLLAGSLSEIQMAVDLLKQVDLPAMQVTLSCIVVEFKRGRGFEIGLHSGATRKTAERDIGARGYLDFMSKDFSVSGAFGKIGLLPDRFEMELASMEENNVAEVLARPRLTTLNGNKAELNVTNTVYYLVSQVSADGYPITDYRSFNDGISLELTPSVTQDGRITLEVSPEIKTAGRSSGDGPRDISTRNLKTVVVLENGETLCLGGLIRKSKSEVRSAVPFLGSIPLLGRLFSYTSEQEEENELAIFITPHVEKEGQ